LKKCIQRLLRNDRLDIRIDHDFRNIIAHCACCQLLLLIFIRLPTGTAIVIITC
jgi:hypothetical protein